MNSRSSNYANQVERYLHASHTALIGAWIKGSIEGSLFESSCRKTCPTMIASTEPSTRQVAVAHGVPDEVHAAFAPHYEELRNNEWGAPGSWQRLNKLTRFWWAQEVISRLNEGATLSAALVGAESTVYAKNLPGTPVADVERQLEPAL